MGVRCGFCGAENPPEAVLCSVCRNKIGAVVAAPQERFRRTAEWQPRGESIMPRFRSQTPIYAGIILILNGIMGIGSLIYVNLYVSTLFPEYVNEFAFYSALVGGLSIFVLLGGAMTIARKVWGLCLAASIAGVILSLFGVMCGIIGLVLSIVGVIFVYLAEKEFD